MKIDSFAVADSDPKTKNLRNTYLYNEELQKIGKSIESGMSGNDV